MQNKPAFLYISQIICKRIAAFFMLIKKNAKKKFPIIKTTYDKGNNTMKLTTHQLKQIIKEELESFIKEVEYHDLKLEPKEEIAHKRLLSQIVKGEVDQKQLPNVQRSVHKAIEKFNQCVQNDHLSPEERSGGEFDHLFDRGGNVDCFDYASDLAKEIMKLHSLEIILSKAAIKQHKKFAQKKKSNADIEWDKGGFKQHFRKQAGK